MVVLTYQKEGCKMVKHHPEIGIDIANVTLMTLNTPHVGPKNEWIQYQTRVWHEWIGPVDSESQQWDK